MGVERHPFSPLINSELFQIGDTVFWDKTRPPEIAARDDDVEYIIKINERIDNLAYEKLGSPQLGWVIMLRNGMSLWPNDFVPGLKIFIPTRDSLAQRGII